MLSIISFPDRGEWGKASYRGNCSGHVQQQLIEHFSPKTFVDICEGSGTSRDVCQELGIAYHGFDLHTGTDFTKQSILEIVKTPADMVFSHPPYGDMIDYGKVGKFTNPDQASKDLSQCSPTDEFLEKSRLMLLNQRDATRVSGIYCTLIGDYRKNGVFISYQSEYIQMMPKDELISVTIKAQHNTTSEGREYKGKFIPIVHEYLLIWRKGKTVITPGFGCAKMTRKKLEL